MATLRIIFFVTLLAAFVLAAPAPARITKRSFKVPRHINAPVHARGLNGAAAVRKVFNKYSLKGGFIAQEKTGVLSDLRVNANNGSTNGSGTVAANPGDNAALFLSPVDIGGQTLNLDFDSGSSDLYVPISRAELYANMIQLGIQHRSSQAGNYWSRRLRQDQVSYLQADDWCPVADFLWRWLWRCWNRRYRRCHHWWCHRAEPGCRARQRRLALLCPRHQH